MYKVLTHVVLCIPILCGQPGAAAVPPLGVPHRLRVPFIPGCDQELVVTRAAQLEFLGDLSTSRNMLHEAAMFYEQSVKAPGLSDFDLLLVQIKLADVYGRMGKYADSERVSLEALNFLTRQDPEEDPLAAMILNNIGWANLKLGRYSQARLFFERALPISEAPNAQGNPLAVQIQLGLADACCKQGAYKRARYLYARAMKLTAAIPGTASDSYRRIRSRLYEVDRLLRTQQLQRLRHSP